MATPAFYETHLLCCDCYYVPSEDKRQEEVKGRKKSWRCDGRGYDGLMG